MPNAHLLDTDESIARLLASLHRVAILGIRGEKDAARPAHYVPAALQRMGLALAPVAVVDLGTDTVLGEKVYRQVQDVPGQIDLVDVFRKASDLPGHLPDLLAARPKAVWFQTGIRNDVVALALSEAGIDVVQDRCLMVEYRGYLAAHVQR